MITPAGIVKLLDFGLAKNDERRGSGEAEVGLARTETLVTSDVGRIWARRSTCRPSRRWVSRWTCPSLRILRLTVGRGGPFASPAGSIALCGPMDHPPARWIASPARVVRLSFPIDRLSVGIDRLSGPIDRLSDVIDRLFRPIDRLCGSINCPFTAADRPSVSIDRLFRPDRSRLCLDLLALHLERSALWLDRSPLRPDRTPLPLNRSAFGLGRSDL